MSNPFALARKYLPLTDEQTQCRVVETDTIQAVKISSRILEDEIWLIFDRSFTPSDGLAIYYPDELPELGSKTPDQLREIHQIKLVFPGCRVIQEGSLDNR
jgi:hypothetical protein